MSGLIYDDFPNRPERPVKRGPTPSEERALRDLLRAMTGATIDIARERRLEDRERRGA